MTACALKFGYIRMTKLTNVGGRVDYVSNEDRQEHIYASEGRLGYISDTERQTNIYAAYEQLGYSPSQSDLDPDKFWQTLAKESQERFYAQGTDKREYIKTNYYIKDENGNRHRARHDQDGVFAVKEVEKPKCIEGRELIIELPNEFRNLSAEEHKQMAEYLSNDFLGRYNVANQVAIHENKTRTNFHCHIVFSERKIIDQTEKKEERIATRDTYYVDGKRATKREALDENNELKDNAQLIRKGEDLNAAKKQYYFGEKDQRFESKEWLKETKEHYFNEVFPELAEKFNVSIETHNLYDHQKMQDLGIDYKTQIHEGKLNGNRDEYLHDINLAKKEHNAQEWKLYIENNGEENIYRVTDMENTTYDNSGFTEDGISRSWYDDLKDSIKYVIESVKDSFEAMKEDIKNWIEEHMDTAKGFVESWNTDYPNHRINQADKEFVEDQDIKNNNLTTINEDEISKEQQLAKQLDCVFKEIDPEYQKLEDKYSGANYDYILRQIREDELDVLKEKLDQSNNLNLSEDIKIQIDNAKECLDDYFNDASSIEDSLRDDLSHSR